MGKKNVVFVVLFSLCCYFIIDILFLIYAKNYYDLSE